MTEALSLFHRSFRLKIISLLGLVALADFLFFGHNAGWTIGAFGMILTGVCVVHNSIILKSSAAWLVLVLTFSQCFLQIEKTSVLAFILMSLGIVSLAVMAQGGWKDDAGLWARRVLSLMMRVLRPLFKVMKAVRYYRMQHAVPNWFSMFVRGWFLPFSLSIVFISLFSLANPIVTKWFSKLDFFKFFQVFSFDRVVFWTFMSIILLAVIRPKLKRQNRAKRRAYKGVVKPLSMTEWAFTKEAVLRSLFIFNVMFACQSVMDMNYLFAGGALPSGITYAQYAHNGAYPLIVTALLAAIFVLVTQNMGRAVSGSKLVHALIYLWIVQNILLVFASIYRTGLYVEVYALTYWRVAAFIWMGLVASGLCWILARSFLEKSNTWLINANMVTLLAVLYVTSFVNIGGFIANYNVMNSQHFSDEGIVLDAYYMHGIGAQALPALKKINETYGDVPCSSNEIFDACYVAFNIQQQLIRDMDDWRRWTYSEYRLLKPLKGEEDGQDHIGYR